MMFVSSRRMLPLLLLVNTVAAFAQPALSTPEPYVSNLDGRGFIDIHSFREQAAFIERTVLEAQDRTCPVSAKQSSAVSPWEEGLQELAAQRQCAGRRNERLRLAEAERTAFSAIWLPVLQAAARAGDKVAEVLLLQCSTTHALLRMGLDSTCDDDENRVLRASNRLLELGFAPAYHYPLLLNASALRGTAVGPQQNRLLQAQLQGALGAVYMSHYQDAIGAAGRGGL